MNQSFDLNLFDKHSKEDWIRKVTLELKGKDPSEILGWRHEKELSVEPMYFREDNSSKIAGVNRGIDKNEWANLAHIDLSSEKSAKNITDSSAFCDGFLLNCGNNVKVASMLPMIADQKELLHFKNTGFDLLAEIKSCKIVGLRGTFGFEPLSSADKISGVEQKVLQILEGKGQNFENFSSINIPGNELVEAGASIPQEVGISLAMMVEYYEILNRTGIDKKLISQEIELSSSIGLDYFHEVAKLRCYRILIPVVQESFGLEQFDTKINASSSFRYKSNIEKTNNLIRNTIEGLASIVGGCNTLCISSTEKPFKAQRTALNISNLLKEEAFLGRVIDPSAGSYYIQNLTETIAEHSWAFFQSIEEQGGFLQAKSSGWIDDKIKENRNWMEDRMKDDSIHLVNVNRYEKEITDTSDLFDPDVFRLSSEYERGLKG